MNDLTQVLQVGENGESGKRLLEQERRGENGEEKKRGRKMRK